MILAYLAYIMPSALLFILLAFYDPNTTFCYKFESNFLLDNTQTPTITDRSNQKNITEKFKVLHSKFFAYNQSKDEDYSYLFEILNHDASMGSSTVEKSFSWEHHLESLSLPNKYFLLKTLGIEDELEIYHKFNADRHFLTKTYYQKILASFKSDDVIENFLSLLREFGFLNFCMEMSKLDNYLGGSGSSLPIVDSSSLTRGQEDIWWRGYSPYDVDNSDDFDVLLDALLVFQDDIRFSEHLVCLAKIFDIDQNILYRDFIGMKDLKVSKTSTVVRRGKYFNRSFSVYLGDGFNNSQSHKDILITVFTGVLDSLTPEVNESSICENKLREKQLLIQLDYELDYEIERTLNDKFKLNTDINRDQIRTGLLILRLSETGQLF